ncbi:MAG: PAS domain-containing protein [Acidimicrobiales bacterium]|nr:PAS domain-containing protein [Acidimicrobiales bacterium]
MFVTLLVAGIFCLFRWFHLIALEPYWLYIAVLIGAAVLRVVFSALWEDPGRRWHQSAFIGANMAIIAVVAYSTGWGPILSIGFLFGAATAYELFGSKAMVPCLVWTAVAMILAQLAIALHLAPTLIRQPRVLGIAGLGLVGALLVIELLGRATAGREALETELRRSERRFSALVTSSSDIVIIVGTDGGLQFASPAFESVLGYSPNEFKSLMAERLLHPGGQGLPSTRRFDCGALTANGCGSRLQLPIGRPIRTSTDLSPICGTSRAGRMQKIAWPTPPFMILSPGSPIAP